MVFLTLFIASCATACLLVTTLVRSSRFLAPAVADQPAAKAAARAGRPRLTLVSNTSQPEL